MKQNSSINKFLLLFVMSQLIAGCHFNSTYSNRERDKLDGEKVLAQFYELIKNKDYKKTYSFFDKRFFEVTDTQKLNEIYNISFEKLGGIENYVIRQWETQAIVGTDSKINYRFLCNVKRSNFASEETITLVSEKEGIKIIGYYVNSNGLLESK